MQRHSHFPDLSRQVRTTVMDFAILESQKINLTIIFYVLVLFLSRYLSLSGSLKLDCFAMNLELTTEDVLHSQSFLIRPLTTALRMLCVERSKTHSIVFLFLFCLKVVLSQMLIQVRS